MDAFAAALKKTVTPNTVVLDIGAGTGIFSLLACQYGARHVFAIEPDPAINLAKILATKNNYQRKITFIKDVSTRVELPEKANIIVSDLRGTLPYFEQHIASIKDARLRHLAPGGKLLPGKDTIFATIFENPEIYRKYEYAWGTNVYGLDLSPGRHLAVNSIHSGHIMESEQLTAPAAVASLDYHVIENDNLDCAFTVEIARSGTAHGLCLWFDTQLIGNIGYTSGPGKNALVYGTAILLFEKPTPVQAGETVRLSIGARLIDNAYVWQWQSIFNAENSDAIKYSWNQNSVATEIPAIQSLRKYSSKHMPELNLQGQAMKFMISKMNGKTTLEDIAKMTCTKFPGVYGHWKDAMGDLSSFSQEYSA